MTLASVYDYRLAAKKRLPHFLFEYIDGGSYAETTLHRNTDDLAALKLRQRVLRDVSHIDLSTTLLGQSLSLPIALAPIGLAGMNARRGEKQALRAAESAGIPFTLSTVGVCALDELSTAARHPFWFQLYMLRDRAFMADLLMQASNSGCSALVFTVDLPVAGARYRDVRSGLAGGRAYRQIWQACMRPRWAWDVGIRGRPHTLGSVAPMLKGRTGVADFFGWLGANFDPSVTWDDLSWVREHWPGPLLIKGVMESDDAKRAVEVGADAIIVSNHGGRQLDGVSSTAEALPRIAAQLAGRLPVLVDGGVRSGLDVVRMMALGADAVMIGRAWAYALAARGEAGVAHVLSLLASEMRVAMALTGCTTIRDIDRRALALQPES